MRKDVKFGLTVGAILVVTLIVYALVLSRSGQAIKSEEANVGAPTAPGDSSSAPNPGDDQANPNPTATDNNQSTSVTDTNPAPATQPTASADQKFDWGNALSNGSKVPADAPERTVTPTIDRVSPNVHPELIDSLPATQPSLPPALSAPAETPAPTVNVPAAPPTIDSQSTSTATATPAPTAASPRTHVIAEGESLWTIAQAVYGNGKYYTKIIAANSNLDPKHLKVGAILSIPPLGQPTGSSQSAAATPRIDSTTQYVVVSGDSLEKIARKLYDDPTMADKLYDANQSTIGQDEDRLKIGMVLKLPEPPTQH